MSHKNHFFVFLILLSNVLYGEVTLADTEEPTKEWELLTSESKIEFTGKQMGVPTSGSFSDFDTKIIFDQNNLDTSYVLVSVDLKSVETPYEILTKVVQTEDWFDIERYPKAVFESNNIKYKGNTEKYSFIAHGIISLRGIKGPIDFHFNILPPSDLKQIEKENLKHVQGKLIMQRTLFGVGQGDWGDTSIVDDNVEIEVNFIVMEKQTSP
tara:strand:+ start:12955 stop:13587 length:633 start_codon:yes stop_codon:yes gene_type:complete